MTTRVSTKPKTESKPAPVAAPAVDQFSAAVTTAANTALKACSKVRVRIAWFGTSVKIDDATAKTMLNSVGSDKGAASLSKRLMSSKSDAMNELRAARKSIDDHIGAWTVPMLALTDAPTSTGGVTFRKDAGTKLIQKKDITTFDERLQYLKGLLFAAADKVDQSLPEVMIAEKEKLGGLFNEKDYPKSVRALIGVEVTYEPTGIDLDWERLCPKIYEREAQMARIKFEAVVENAASEWAQQFVKFVSHVVEQLGNRKRVNPVLGSKYAQYKDAEVMDTAMHDQDDSVPAGMIAVKLRLQKGDRPGKSDEVWIEPMTLVDYQTVLRPYEAVKERKKLYPSTIENLKNEMDKFRNIGELLGPYKTVIGDAVDKVNVMLGKGDAGLDSENIAKKLREGSYFRDEMTKALSGVATLVSDQVVDSVEKRRKVSKRMIGMSFDD